MEDNLKEVDISYTYNFPVEIVFDAWVNPDFLPQWFAPNGCSIEFKKLDIREGGTFHSVVRNPAFGDCWCVGTYTEITRPTKLVFSMINADEAGVPIDPSTIGMHKDWPGKTIVTVTFSETMGKTIVNLHQTAPESIARKTGAYQSWLQMFERMGILVGEATH